MKFIFNVGYAGGNKQKVEVIANDKRAAIEKIKRHIKNKLGGVSFPIAGDFVNDRNDRAIHYTLIETIKTQDGSMPPAFRIEFYSPRLGNRQSAYVTAKTKNEAINKFFKEKPQYKGKIEIKSVTMLNARELPKQKALKVGDSIKTQDSQSRVFDRLFKMIRIKDTKQYKINCLGTGIFKPFSKNVVVKIERGTDAIFEAQKFIIRELVKNGIKDFRGTENGLISGDGKSKMEFKNLDNPRKTPLWSVVFKSPLNHTKSGLIVSPIRAETKADAIRIFYKEQPQLKGKGEIVSVTQGTPPSVKRTDLVQKRPKIGDSGNSKKIFNISAHLKGGNSVRHFVAIGTSKNEVKNKVKRLFLTRGEYEFIISENPTFSMERFNKLAQGKEVIRNELRS